MLSPSPAKLNVDRPSMAMLEPFHIMEYDNVVDGDFFHRLDQAFPGKAEFPASWTNRGGKYFMEDSMPEFADFVARTPIWAELFEQFTAPAATEKFRELVRAGAAERPGYEKRPWRISQRGAPSGFFRKPLKRIRQWQNRLSAQTPVRLHFEFSYLESKCYIPPHTDTPGKLLTLMMYFPDAGATYPVGTGTEFYRGKNGGPTREGWKAGMMDDESMRAFLQGHEIFYVADFAPNRLVGFVKSSYSWHGVQPLTLPEGVTRRSLNINYYVA